MPETKTQPETEEKRPFLGLSLTQLVGGGAAAATAALLGSRLGTTGTIIGAAVASIVSAVASALYTASLARTRQVVVATREILPTTMTLRQRGDLPHVADQPEGSDDDVAAVADAEADPDAQTSLWSRIKWKPVLLAGAAVFVVGALLITGIEAVTGQSLSGSGRSTFDSVTHTGKQPRDEATRTPSETPSDDTTDDGSTTPTPSESATPSEDPTEEPSDDPTENQSVSPTPTPSGVPSPTPTE